MASKLALAGGLVAVFVVIAIVLLRAMPGPHNPTDYLIIGTVATFVCIVTVFLLTMPRGDTFYRRKK